MYVVYIFQYLAFFIETNVILTEEKMFTIKKNYFPPDSFLPDFETDL